MNVLLKSLLVFTVLGISTAYWTDEIDDVDAGYSDDDDDSSDLLQAFKRAMGSPQARKLCIPWRAPCTHDDALLAKYTFLRCCNSGACKCNLWGNNCRCEATLGR